MTHPGSLTVRPRKVSFPKGKDHLPTIHFQGGFVKFEGLVLFYSKMNLLIFVPNMVPKLLRTQWLGGTPAVHRRRFRVESWLRYHQQSYVSSDWTGGGGWCGFFWWFENLLIFCCCCAEIYWLWSCLQQIHEHKKESSKIRTSHMGGITKNISWDSIQPISLSHLSSFVCEAILRSLRLSGWPRWEWRSPSILSRWFCFGLRLLSTKGSSWW